VLGGKESLLPSGAELQTRECCPAVWGPCTYPGLMGWDVPFSPWLLQWGVSGTSVASLCSAALLEVLVLVGSSGACSKVLAAPLTPCFPSSFSTSENHTTQNPEHQLGK
jgi:hypothetical protein